MITFADRPTLYLHALAATVQHFGSGRPLYVLGLSGARMPDARISGVWGRTQRRAIKVCKAPSGPLPPSTPCITARPA